MMDSPPLDAVQQRVVDGSASARRIVLAGPGSGKSHVVGAWAEQLVREHDIYPEEILVISFSRAAVQVVRERTAHVTDRGHTVDVATIDSLAARIIRELDEDERPFRDHDSSIRAATRLLTENRDGPVLEHRHVIVDEVQDVVGDRARFVLALLKHAVEEDAGFTLLGDPLQSLYDFQLTDADTLGVDAFVGEVRRLFEVTELRLSGNHRSRSEDTRRVAAARDSLEGRHPEDRLLDLQEMAADLIPLGSIDADAVADIGRWRGTTALLCDTNAAVALVAEHLAELGLVAETASSLADPALPAWFGRLASSVDGNTLSFNDFQHVAAADLDVDRAWDLLLDLTDARRDVDLRKLPGGLARHRRYLQRAPEQSVVVSTVHRAKGLEFDNVVLVGEERWGLRDHDPDRTARMLFVAMTRGRDHLTRVRGVDTRQWTRDRWAEGTWVRSSFRNRKARLGLILEPAHARALGPATVDFHQVIGRSVRWEQDADHLDVDGTEAPSWLARIDGVPIARTGLAFGRMIRSWSFGGESLPTLHGGRVQGEESIIGAPDDSTAAQVWVGARVAGPVDLEWGSNR